MKYVYAMAAAVVALAGSAHAQCPAVVELDAVYAAEFRQNGTLVRGLLNENYGAASVKPGVYAGVAVLFGFNTETVPSMCRVTSATYRLETRNRKGRVHINLGMFGGAGLPVGTFIDSLSGAFQEGRIVRRIWAERRRYDVNLPAGPLASVDAAVAAGHSVLTSLHGATFASGVDWFQQFIAPGNPRAASRPRLTLRLTAR